MNIVDQVCTLEQGKKLKELGVVQHSHFAWAYNSFGNGDPYADSLESINNTDRSAFDSPEIICSAYTVAELGLMLPPHYFTIQSIRENGNLVFTSMFYNGRKDPCFVLNVSNDNQNEAEMRAAMLIHLIEETLGQLALTNQVLYKQQNL